MICVEVRNNVFNYARKLCNQTVRSSGSVTSEYFKTNRAYINTPQYFPNQSAFHQVYGLFTSLLSSSDSCAEATLCTLTKPVNCGFGLGSFHPQTKNRTSDPKTAKILCLKMTQNCDLLQLQGKVVEI